MVRLSDITIRTDIQPGDLGYAIFLHGSLYGKEYGYNLRFETYVAEGLLEFYRQYNPDLERVWVCEHSGTIAAFLVLMNRGESAQLRYFIIKPEYRGIGLGKKLMHAYLEFFKKSDYQSTYLWTNHELVAAASLYKKHGFILAEVKESGEFGKIVTEQKYILNKILPQAGFESSIP